MEASESSADSAGQLEASRKACSFPRSLSIPPDSETFAAKQERSARCHLSEFIDINMSIARFSFVFCLCGSDLRRLATEQGSVSACELGEGGWSDPRPRMHRLLPR